MNNIASLKTIELPAHVQARLALYAPALVAAAILAILLISFEPFPAAQSVTDAPGSSKINQIGFGAIALISLASLAIWVDPRVYLKLLSPGWMAMGVILGLSIVAAADSGAALRSIGFSLAAILGILAVLCLPRDGGQFSFTLLLGCGIFLAMNYFGIIFKPGAALHGAGGLEPQHAGLWRGVYSHKNITGPVMAILSFIGIYIWRARQSYSGLAIAFFAVFFVLQTGSKTSVGTLFVVMAVIWGPSLLGLRFLGAFFTVIILIFFATFTLGTVIFEPVADIMEAVAPGNSYSGRTDLWAFSLQMVAEQPWLGYGFDTLWGKPAIMEMERPFDAGWDFRGIVNAHSSYLDLALDLGLPALAVMIWLVIFKPIKDYLLVKPSRENILLADMFLMIMLFACMNGFMESFFLRRGNPVWLLLALAIFGLHMTAQYAVPKRKAIPKGDI